MKLCTSRLGCAVFLALCLAGSLQNGSPMASAQTNRNPKSFGASVELERQSGLKVIVLKYADPLQPGKGLEARVVPEAGSNLYSLKVDETELLVQPAKLGLPAIRYGFPILFPTPNRVRDSRFTFEGQTFNFRPNERTNFIHGLVHSVPWQFADPTANDSSASVETFLNWDPATTNFSSFPIRHQLRIKFTLDSQGVRLTFTVENRDERRLPFGFAFHPWFQVLGSRKETYLYVPAQKHMEAEGLLPTGKLENLEGSPYDLRSPVSLESLRLDNVYWGLVPEKAPGYEIRDRGLKISLVGSKEFTHMVVYTPPGKPFFCMENQTCSTDAHNLHARGFEKAAHLLIIDKGKSLSGSVYVKVEKT